MSRFPYVLLLLAGCFSEPPGVDGGEPGTSSTGAPPITQDPSASSVTSSSSASATVTTSPSGGTGTTEDGSTTGTTDESDSGESSSSTSTSGSVDEEIVFDFTEDHCAAAQWAWSTSGANAPLACGVPSTGNGSTEVFESAELQDGDVAGPILALLPPDGEDGVASGTYASISIGPDEHLLADIACPAEAPQCDFGWQVVGRLFGAGGPPEILEFGSQNPSTGVEPIEIDLTAYEGASFDFTFGVLINGTYSPDDHAHFVHPRIVHRPNG